MARVKKSSGKEYHRLSQAADSDEEILLYSLSSSPPSRPSRTSTTEFGAGHYDRSQDLELPAVTKPSRKRRGLLVRTRRRSGKLRFSREAGACVCFLLLLAVVVGVLVAASKLVSNKFLVPSPLGSSLVVSTTTQNTAPASTPTAQAPTSRGASPSGEVASPTPSPLPEEHSEGTHPPQEPTQGTSPPPEDHSEGTTSPPEDHSEGTTLPPEDHSEGTTLPPEDHSEGTTLPPEDHSEGTTLPPEDHKALPPTDNKHTGNEWESSGEATLVTTPVAESTWAASLTETAATVTNSPASPSPPTPSPESLSPASMPSTEPPTPSLESPSTFSPESPSTPSLESPSTPSPESPFTPSHTTTGSSPASISWEREFPSALTETSLQLRDIDRDGVVDVLMVEAAGMCDARVLALDGLTGDVVWEAHVDYEAFALKCDVDLNGDDIIDCIAAGRSSGFRALSGVDGTVLWDRDPRSVYFRYNFYYPLLVPDLDGDEVMDIINTHGGDTTYKEEDTERSPSFLVALSGRTGQQLMERVPVPDGHETYMSPVLLSRRGGEDMVLVGTGGETLPGALWAISYNSLRTRILNYRASNTQFEMDYTPFVGYVNHPCNNDMTEKELEDLRPVFDVSSFNASRATEHDDELRYLSLCGSWGGHDPVWNRYGLCVYRLLGTEEKGVMLPPVMADMTGDALDDLVVSTFEGRTLVINGDDGSVVWEVMQPGTESYSVPAPLFYNSDDTLDLLVRLNYGAWDHYNRSTIAILDGQNGDTLWSLDSVQDGLVSGLSLAGDQPGEDAAVFIAVGTTDEESPVINEDGGEQRRSAEVRERRHNGPDDTLGEAEEEGTHPESSGSEEFSDYSDFIAEDRDPVGLWEGMGVEFPDPRTNLSAFLSYCGWSERELTASLYVLPRRQILTGFIQPLASHGPTAYIPDIEKRHGGTQPDHTYNETAFDLSKMSPEAIQQLRCGHVMAPNDIISSPAIGDLNGDGRLEVAYIMMWGKADKDIDIGQSLPPRFTLYVATLEEMVKEVFGEEGVEWVQAFLPGDQQPWARYMGSGGDNVYHRPPFKT